jgi:phosphohistidine swiveling domain-containing protein
MSDVTPRTEPTRTERMRFSSKARTLQSLEGRLRASIVLPQETFTVQRWRQDAKACLQRVRDRRWPLMAVRSSSTREDGATSSGAGQFDSRLRVSSDQLVDAIEQVIGSMGGNDAADVDEVFVQPMVVDAVLAGVVFGVDPNSGAPYFVVNYDAASGKTDTVTSGISNDIKIFYSHHAATEVPEELRPVLTMVRELQEVFAEPALDIEFAQTRAGDMVLLQARPLVLKRTSASVDEHARVVAGIARRVAAGVGPQPFLHGPRTVYGVMPDWNPAEIIGIRPRPLALSLYRELVTDMIWAYQRNNYGYRNLRSFPLLVHFHGLPFIDVRVSFNSFIPKDIDGALADRLVAHYIDKLLSAPSLHDKVEFEIVYSCYTLDLPKRLEELRGVGFSNLECERLSDSLRKLTNRIIDNQTGLWKTDRDKLQVLLSRRDEILSAGADRISRIYWLLEDCSRYGTLPFAGLARAGFIAVQLLRSLVSVGVLDGKDYNAFLNGLNTVSGQMTRDLRQMDKTTFLGRYGHLRPGTYDILSPRYDEAPDVYFDWNQSSRPAPSSTTGVPSVPVHTEGASPFALSLSQMRDISRLLAEHGLTHDVVGLFDFLQAGIELREYAKFVFTRNLSDAMSLFRDLGQSLGFSAEDMSFANIQVIKELNASSSDPGDLIGKSIAEGRRRYAETCQIVLPPLVTRPEDVWAFHLPQSEPNFITHGQATGPVVQHRDRDRLAGAIVVIPSADPGFDWLFSHRIAGFITAYGGANSHMAIRANELGLPAVIGAGEALFQRWSSASRLRVDCANRRVEVLA